MDAKADSSTPVKIRTMAIRAGRLAHPAPARFCEPLTGLYAAAAGNLYGTTLAGGSANAGTVNNLAPDDTETVLHALNGATKAHYTGPCWWPTRRIISAEPLRADPVCRRNVVQSKRIAGILLAPSVTNPAHRSG